MGELDYSLLIVTVRADDRLSGCLVGFATQVSIHPPRFLVCLSVKNRTYEVALEAGVLVVHFVPQQAEGLAALFGGETGDDIDKFARCEWREGPAATPVLLELEDWFAGRILERIDFGDHCGFVLEPSRARRIALVTRSPSAAPSGSSQATSPELVVGRVPRRVGGT